MTELTLMAGLGELTSSAPGVSMSHHYVVLIDNLAYNLGGWSRAAGLKVTWDKLEHREGDHGNYVHFQPGATKYEPIELSRAAGPPSRVVQAWLAQTSRSPTIQSGTIQLVDYSGTPVVQWRLSELFPIAWSIETFDAAGAKPAIETLQLAHTGFLEDDLAVAASMLPSL